MGMQIARISRAARINLIAAVAAGAFALAGSARAVVILPSQSLTPTGSGTITGSQDADTGAEAFSGQDTFHNVVFSGSIDSKVFTDALTGDLDFEYQFSNSAASPDEIESLTVGGFSAFNVNADYIPSTGTAIPTNVTRSSSGSNVGFDFPGASAVVQGTNTDDLVIKTNATQYALGFATIQDGGNGSASVYVPAVPEPTTAAIAALALFGLGARRSKHQSR
jgi:hypothetical protein